MPCIPLFDAYRDIIEDYDIKHKDNNAATGLSGDTLAKLDKDDPYQLDSLEEKKDIEIFLRYEELVIKQHAIANIIIFIVGFFKKKKV